MTALVRIPGGILRMGSEAFYPEEGPVHDVPVATFAISAYAVTNREFEAFVEATEYITVAERELVPADFPDADLASVEPGSLVFQSTAGPVDLRDWRQWWRWVPGATWRHPFGPASGVESLGAHPVVQIAYPDALAYATWAEARLPTEAEWEFAARGGLVGATYSWGEEPNDGTRANTWQGRFPYDDTKSDGPVRTMPVGSLPPNGYGLHEMTGNTWEWTATVWTARHAPKDPHCSPASHPSQAASRVLKGGSHLCAPEYCLRYRPAARTEQAEDSATTHIGFRLARDVDA